MTDVYPLLTLPPQWNGLAWFLYGLGLALIALGFACRRSALTQKAIWGPDDSVLPSLPQRLIGITVLAYTLIHWDGRQQPILLGTAIVASLVWPWPAAVPVRGGRTHLVLLWLLTPAWALVRRRSCRRLRAGGLTTFRALWVSRSLTADQVERLGWPGSTIQSLVGFRDRFVPVPRGWTLRRLGMLPGTEDILVHQRKWYVPGRPDWNVENLIQLAQARPDDGSWYLEHADQLVTITSNEVTRNALQHLRSAPDQNLDAVFQLSRATVPPAIFQQVLAALSHPGVTHFPAEAIKQAALKLVASLVPAVTAGEVDWEEVPGWLTFGNHRGARSRFAFGGYRADTFPQVIATWHEYHVAAGRKAPHAALLWAAGYTVTEALTLVAAGEVPDRETLETMGALQGSSDDYTNIFAEEH